jgi:hypothetical protein
MSKILQILISAGVILTAAIFLSRSLKLSSRYERKPHKLTDWNLLDKGIDPTQHKAETPEIPESSQG